MDKEKIKSLLQGFPKMPKKETKKNMLDITF